MGTYDMPRPYHIDIKKKTKEASTKKRLIIKYRAENFKCVNWYKSGNA